MSLDAGTITVAGDGSYTGTGLALALMDQRVVTLDAQWTAAAPMYSAHKAAIRGALAQSCIDDAAAITAWLAAGGYT